MRSVRLNTCELPESSLLKDVGWTGRIGSHYPSCCPGDLLQSANVTFLCVAEETDQIEENGILYHGLVEQLHNRLFHLENLQLPVEGTFSFVLSCSTRQCGGGGGGGSRTACGL